MIPILTITIRCAHPECKASIVLDVGSYGSVRDRPKNLPTGWFWHNQNLQACPEHASEAIDADQAAYEWAVKRTDAYNKLWKEVRKAHPQPRHPAWLNPIWKERENL